MFWKQDGIEKKDLLTPGAVLIGAILISISISWGPSALPSFSSGSNTGGDQAQVEAKVDNGDGGGVAITKRNDAATEGKGKIELVEFSDFQCPFCKRFHNDVYKQIKAKYIDTNKVKFTYRHYPLPSHQNAQKAAEASECANDQGKFFEYHDVLFENSESNGAGLAVSDLKQYAVNLGLNVAKFDKCLDSGAKTEIVKKDLAEGQRLGVKGTPTIYVDGVAVIGAQPFSIFETAIEKALGN